LEVPTANEAQTGEAGNPKLEGRRPNKPKNFFLVVEFSVVPQPLMKVLFPLRKSGRKETMNLLFLISSVPAFNRILSSLNPSSASVARTRLYCLERSTCRPHEADLEVGVPGKVI
jgi:hypothetical protein